MAKRLGDLAFSVVKGKRRVKVEFEGVAVDRRLLDFLEDAGFYFWVDRATGKIRGRWLPSLFKTYEDLRKEFGEYGVKLPA